MASEDNCNDEPLAAEEIGNKIRQQKSSVVSPIDISLQKVEILKAKRLKWFNFFEPPSKLVLRNSGNSVRIQGQWPHQKPTLCGGPLDTPYVFSQIHFHYGMSSHVHNTHTINGKSPPLEMHVVFYNSSYKTQAEALGKNDGILIVAYFFKVEPQSSIGWLTDHLGQVTSTKTVTQLPSGPLSALVPPFTQDYLAYWGALSCTCHQALWLLSRSPLSITAEELRKFGELQCDLKERINNEELKSAKVEENIQVYLINPTNESQEVLLSDPINPPLQISKPPKGSALDGETVRDNKTKNTSHEALVKSNSKVLEKNSTLKEVLTLKPLQLSETDSRNISTTNQNSSSPGKINELENKDENVREVKTEIIKDDEQRKLIELLREVKESAMKWLDVEKEEAHSMNISVDELKESLLNTAGSKENPNEIITNELIHILQIVKGKSSCQESTLTSNPKSVLVENNYPCKKENVENINVIVSDECKEMCKNTQSDDLVEEKECKKKSEPTKSKVPVKFTPWKPHEGLKSSLTPFFSGSKGGPPLQKPDPASSMVKKTTRIPRLNQKSIKNNETAPRENDLGGEGDHVTSLNSARKPSKKARSTISSNVKSK
ncbi:uncharacterized protein LOC128990188 [Macrosteles quadrilineatus]|uniref:uncharacterized protein LOC128990188 n=1 Tax=Macrosteles quadrilineatus TaxID=74068 RepID=UPI0023E2758D|nr:uncharacterized protein LOC128990188 [Macrosteles quadrilineatus]